MRRRVQDAVRRGATIPTLVLALTGPPGLAIIGRRVLGDSSDLRTLLPFDVLFWAMLAVVLLVVVRVERQPLASIGLRRPRPSTVVWALLLLALTSLVLVPAAMWVADRAGLSGYERGLRRLLELPVWYRVFLAISAGVIEETLYRGYAVERLASLTGSYWIGGSLAVAAFGVAHVPAWGPGPSLVAMTAGAMATAFYVWKRDLAALILAHGAGDAIGLVLLPPTAS